MTLIVGSEGSMGRRYKAILKWMDEPFDCYDIGVGDQSLYKKARRFIIATPTDTHFRFVKNLENYGVPILCEKPLSTDLSEIKRILDCKCPLSMTMQYKYLASDVHEGASWYNFYNHGKDGLIWDCFQIIALAKGKVSLNESSPLWTAGLNGNSIRIQDMDGAYIDAVADFLVGKHIERETLWKWHKKVSEFKL